MLGYSLGMKSTLEAIHANTSFFGHPRGLATCFFTEMWERFSYYGMRAILILFMTASVAKGGLGFSVVKAGAIYGFYTAMVYLLSLPGGWVADRIFGQRRAVLYGGILIVAGEFALMSSEHQRLLCGLGSVDFRDGNAEAQREHDGGPALCAERPAARFGLLDFLHGHQSGRAAFAAGVRMGGRADQLAAGFWPGRRGDGGGAHSIRAGREVSGNGGTASGD